MTADTVRPTLKDVARHAGVSVTTAHVALTDRRDGVRVPEPTRERVRRAAEDIGYRPNLVARHLRTQRTSTIGFLSDEVTTTPFAVSMLGAAQDEAASRGHLLVVVSLGADPTAAMRRQAVEVLLQQQVAGIVYACMYHRRVTPPPGLPGRSVFLNATPTGGGFRGIVPDDRQGGYDAVAALVRAGHRRIAYLDELGHAPASALRYEGYRAALADAGLQADRRWHHRALPVVRGGLEAGAFLDLPARARPTAVACYNDRQAMGAYRAVRLRGLRVPDDVSIVGYDDQEYIASELDPPLTTVRLPHVEMGRLAVRLLLDEGVGGDDVIRVPCPLVERDSVGPPRKEG